jgi:hypothetical protein
MLCLLFSPKWKTKSIKTHMHRHSTPISPSSPSSSGKMPVSQCWKIHIEVLANGGGADRTGGAGLGPGCGSLSALLSAPGPGLFVPGPVPGSMQSVSQPVSVSIPVPVFPRPLATPGLCCPRGPQGWFSLCASKMSTCRRLQPSNHNFYFL